MIRKYAEIFCWKNVSSFCSAKATHIFSAKNIRILYIESAKTVDEMTLNELVKLTTLWTTGPRSFVTVEPNLKFLKFIRVFVTVEPNLEFLKIYEGPNWAQKSWLMFFSVFVFIWIYIILVFLPFQFIASRVKAIEWSSILSSEGCSSRFISINQTLWISDSVWAGARKCWNCNICDV